jgi:hypothetical protein
MSGYPQGAVRAFQAGDGMADFKRGENFLQAGRARMHAASLARTCRKWYILNGMIAVDHIYW